MKKYSIFAIAVIFALSLAACGRNNDNSDNGVTIMPDVMPTLETNIPDPDVDTKMPMYTDGNDSNQIDPTGNTNDRTRNGF